ncbi:MAG: serine hydrolase [Mobilitalea sp.]
MIKQFINDVTNSKFELYNIRVMQEGKLIAGHDFAPNIRRPIYSVTKSFTSTALGMAMDEGDLRLEDSILKYLESDLPTNCSQDIKDSLEHISIKRLLTMSVWRYPFRPKGDDWLSYCLQVPLSDVQRVKFAYSNIPAYLIGVIVEKVVKQNVMDFLQPRLMDPLGIKSPIYSNCPKGHFNGATGMELTVDELALFGQLYLQKGTWKDVALINPSWIEQATTKQIDNKDYGYGYYFWITKPAGYLMSGKLGQRCYVFPEKQLVITYQGNLDTEDNNHKVDLLMLEHFYEKL